MKRIFAKKSYIDQSFMEIFILKYLKQRGDPNENHFLDLLDYFYFNGFLYLVTELLQIDLFKKLNQ